MKRCIVHRFITDCWAGKPNWAGSAFVLAVWVAAVGAGFRALIRYESAAAPLGDAPRIEKSFTSDGKASLVLALHPKCPCSAATVDELVNIYSRASRGFTITVLAYKPAEEPETWIESTSVKAVRELRSRIVIDNDGAEAKRLGMTASGQVLLYDRTGHLLYNGGITGARGHRGDNVGEQTVLAMINGTTAPATCAPVFGCSLFEGSL